MEHPRRSGLLADADIALVSINTGTEVALHLNHARARGAALRSTNCTAGVSARSMYVAQNGGNCEGVVLL